MAENGLIITAIAEIREQVIKEPSFGKCIAGEIMGHSNGVTVACKAVSQGGFQVVLEPAEFVSMACGGGQMARLHSMLPVSAGVAGTLLAIPGAIGKCSVRVASVSHRLTRTVADPIRVAEVA